MCFFPSVWLGELSKDKFPLGLGNGGSFYFHMRAAMTEVPAYTEN